MREAEFCRILPKKLGQRFKEAGFAEWQGLQEIRLRAERPIQVKQNNRLYFLSEKTFLPQKEEKGAAVLAKAELKECISFLSAYSLYAFEDELKQGYLTIAGGHRVGFAGKAVMERGELKTQHHINGLNIRIARDVKGCAEKLMPFLLEGDRFCHTLLISPPACGKTTLLRDIIRTLSSGKGCAMRTVGVVDERGELVPMADGVPQMDAGPSTDVLEGCPKAKGMLLLLRSMSPDVIAVDELGSAENVRAVEEVLNAGVACAATAHGTDLADLKIRPCLRELFEKRLFERYVFLSSAEGTGTIEAIYDREGQLLQKRGREG